MDEINKMFSKISSDYDFMNHLMSFNFDKGWRKEAAKDTIISKKEYNVLDVAAGTGDLAIAVSKMAEDNGKKVSIYAYDFNKDMLAIADKKFKKEGMKNIKIEHGNAFKINHKTSSFDIVISGFGLRSFFYSKGGKKNLQKFISESYRVLKPDGKIILLDMAMPDKKHQKAFFRAYSLAMLAMGSFIDRETYAWLVRTIKLFDKKGLVSIMGSSGFKKIQTRSLRSGIAYIVTAQK